MTCAHCAEEVGQPFAGMLCLRCKAPLVACVRCVARLLARLREVLGPEKARRAITETTLTATVVIELESGHRC